MSKVAEDGRGDGNIILPESLLNINLPRSINLIGIEVFNGYTLLANNILPESC